MSRLLRAALAALVFCFAAGGHAHDFSRQQLQDIYRSGLQNDGYRPELTPAGNVRFRRQGRVYTLYVDERDPAYFRLVGWFGARVSTPEARARRLEAANRASRRTKAVKVFVSERGNLGISAEFYQLVPGDGLRSLDRIFASFDLAYRTYRENE